MPAMKRITYREKIEQTHREAKATVVALLVTIVAWALLGFGLSTLDVQVFHMPLWVLGATIGVYVVSLVVIVVLRHAVFCDFDLDEHAQASTQSRPQSDTQSDPQAGTGGTR